ncbi:SAE2-domain-containing protein [Daldinia sp. FL1419]|nr:SAE2-domain-containing protein [Daldinia sp. FL1419]
MENWFKDVGRPALFDALAGVCNQIDNELGEELKSYRNENVRLSTELDNFRSKASNADRLKEENLALKKELQAFRDRNRPGNSSRSQSKTRDDVQTGRSPLTSKSVNQVSNIKLPTTSAKIDVDGLGLAELKEEYLKLSGNYTKLHERYLVLDDAHAKLNQRLRDKTKAYYQWMNHATQLDELSKKRSRIIKKLEAKLDAAAAAASGPLNESFSSDTPVPPANQDRAVARESVDSDVHDKIWPMGLNPSSKETLLRHPSTGINENESDSSRGEASLEPIRIKTESRTTLERNCITRSESTISTVVGESYPLPPLPQNQSTSPREVLIKTEPSSDPPVVVSERCIRKRKYDDDQTGNGIKVKTEGGSDPLITDEYHHFIPHESIDFDAEGGRVVTPRKRNRTSFGPGEVSVSDLVRVTGSHVSSERLSRLEDSPVYDAARRRTFSSLPLLDGDSDDAHAGNDPLAPRFEVFDNTTPIQQKLGRHPSTKRKEPSSTRIASAHLVEDGMPNKNPRTTKKGLKGSHLHDLLNTPSPGHGTVDPPLSIQSDHARISKQFEFQAPQRRELPFSKNDSRKSLKLGQSHDVPETLHSKRNLENVNATRLPNDGAKGSMTGNVRPLRERPRSELGIADFKINPKSNEGYNYAFTDVVRNKNERASLEGCIQEGCCGQTFRLQARAKRDQTGPADFQTLLERHMGDEAWKLSTMTKAEKEDMWLEAKMRELANEHGKHRHRFHRAASPVGFWRADFPSTQEEQRDKEEAAKATRRIIDERYREAMRPGGRWIFRDE